jgi:hypothetical protein
VRRNSNIESWIEFFNYCREKFPVKFIVICAINEVDPRLRSLPNVVITKDYGTTAEQDLALIDSSAMYLATNSGMCLMAIFNKVPYSVVNWPLDDLLNLTRPTVVPNDTGFRYTWATPHQRLTSEPDTLPLLIREFEYLYGNLRLGDGREITNPRTS